MSLYSAQERARRLRRLRDMHMIALALAGMAAAAVALGRPAFATVPIALLIAIQIHSLETLRAVLAQSRELNR
jgi:hypothetical protein